MRSDLCASACSRPRSLNLDPGLPSVIFGLLLHAAELSAQLCKVLQPPAHRPPLHAVYFQPPDRGPLPSQLGPRSLCGPDRGPPLTHTRLGAKGTARMCCGLAETLIRDETSGGQTS